MVFARINTGIYTGARPNAFDKCDSLVGAHRSPGIMTIFFEIEYEQDTCARSHCRIGLCPRSGDNTEEMISLPNWITSISVVICPPEQSRLQRSHLAIQIFRVTNEGWVGGFVNYAHNALTFHCGKIGTHHVVVGKVHYVRCRKRADRKRRKQNCNAQDRRSHAHGKSHGTH